MTESVDFSPQFPAVLYASLFFFTTYKIGQCFSFSSNERRKKLNRAKMVPTRNAVCNFLSLKNEILPSAQMSTLHRRNVVGSLAIQFEYCFFDIA